MHQRRRNELLRGDQDCKDGWEECVYGQGGLGSDLSVRARWVELRIRLWLLAIGQTHCDIIEDFSMDFAGQLVELSKAMDFIIFEDRKFADIGGSCRHLSFLCRLLGTSSTLSC